MSEGAQISVVIPCFNDAEFLRDAVASVRSTRSVEIIIVDDGSDDQIDRESLTGWIPPNTRCLVIRQDNQGPSAARMTGVRASSAPLIFVLDADDRLLPGALDDLADALEAESGAGIAWGDVAIMHRPGVIYRKADALDPLIIRYLNEIPSSALFRREVLERGGWVSSLGFEDWDMWMAMASRGEVGLRIPRPTYEYRVHDTSRVSQVSRSQLDAKYREFQRRHRPLFSSNRGWQARGGGPRLLRLTLMGVEVLPISRSRKLLLGSVASHIFHHRPLGELVAKARLVRRGQGSIDPW